MTFSLEIRLANDAMQTPNDVGQALISLAARLDGHDWRTDDGIVRDLNGNTVGHWTIVRT